MDNIITRLRKLNIGLSLRDGALKINAPKGVMTAGIWDDIKKNKEFITQYIRDASSKNDFRPPEKTAIRDHYRLSSSQKRLYISCLLDPASVAYNMPAAFDIEGYVDTERLEQLFNSLIARHESLRTSFLVVDGEPVQCIKDRITLDIRQIPNRVTETGDLLRDFVRPFDLAVAPLIRVGFMPNGRLGYLLLIDMHHLITDGLSRQILMNEFMTLYNGGELPALPLQYKDYAEWQQNDMKSERSSKARDFWMRELRDALPPPNLPLDFPRPVIRDLSGDCVPFYLDYEETAALRRCAEKEGATLFMAVLALFYILLSRLGNQKDIVVGVAVAGREHTELMSVIGMFVNMLPVRHSLEGELPFGEFLSLLRIKILECLDNQAHWQEDSLAVLKEHRTAGRHPLFETAFAYEIADSGRLALGDSHLKKQAYRPPISKFDLTLSATESEKGLALHFEYSTKLFKKDTIERFISYFRQILAAVISQPHILIRKIEMIPEGEKQLLTGAFNDTAIEYPDEGSVLSLFQRQLRRTPASQAVVYGEAGVTYQQLNDQADSMARTISRCSVTNPGRRVCLLFSPSIEMVTAILAIVKAGCTYIPLSPEAPVARNGHIYRDSGAGLLLVGWQLPEADPALVSFAPAEEVIVFGKGASSGEKEATVRPDARPEDPVYIIYTSGTTGAPKGVEVNHGGLLNMLHFYGTLFKPQEHERHSQLANICFDAAAFEIWSSLVYGGCLHIAPGNIKSDPTRIMDWLIKSKIGIAFLPTVIAEHLLTREWEPHQGVLRILNIAGDRLGIHPVKKMPFRIYNLYGPTEDSIWTTWQEIKPDNQGSYYSIGKPIANKKVFILNEDGLLQPVGVPGELCICGYGLATCYVNNERLTREKFPSLPFGSGERMYRTGDLATWMPDGNLAFLGRIDDQVKIRGNRVETAEIEHWLSRYEGIKAKAVIAVDRAGEQQLVAYYTSDGVPDVTGLRNYLSRHLPDYMIPSCFMQLNNMPFTANGKLDRKALPAPDIRAGHAYRGPSGQVQEVLVSLWAEVLKIDREHISVSANFFELGGHSINIVTLNDKINRRFQCQMPLVNMFRFPTVLAMAEQMTNGDKDEAGEARAIDQGLEEANWVLGLLEDKNN